eukprot:10413807-Alexandrium_andersonii.AAC.1
MSASLVGSEMCIRDRLPASGSKGVSDRISLPLLLREGPGLDRLVPLAVSYTHLTLPTICSV